MSILIDLSILAIIALCTFIGYKRGLIKASIRIFAFFIAIIIALLLYRPVAGFIIEHTPIGNSIQNRLVSQILPEGIYPDDEVRVEENFSGILENAAVTTVNTLAGNLTVQIIEIGTLLLIFFIVKFGLRFITVLTDFITKIPILKQFNEIRRNYIWLCTRFVAYIHHISCNICSRTNDIRNICIYRFKVSIRWIYV